jgi:hypothetical protein
MRLDWTAIGTRVQEATGFERDAFDKVTRRLCYWGAGAVKHAKRSYTRRLRHETKRLLSTYDHAEYVHSERLSQEAEELWCDMREEGFAYDFDDIFDDNFDDNFDHAIDLLRDDYYVMDDDYHMDTDPHFYPVVIHPDTTYPGL